MKTEEIVLGGVYGDGKGNVREVVAEGAQYQLYRGQNDSDCIRWRSVKRGARGKVHVGTEGNMTRNSMAKWARERVTNNERTDAAVEAEPEQHSLILS